MTAEVSTRDVGLDLLVDPSSGIRFRRATGRGGLANRGDLRRLGGPSGFAQLLPATIVTAGVDRFMHHAHLVITDGDPYRFAQARVGKGMTPPV